MACHWRSLDIPMRDSGKFNDRHTTATTGNDRRCCLATSRRFPRAVPGLQVEEHQNAVFLNYATSTTRGPLVLPYKLANKQHRPKRWGGGCNTPRQLVIGSWRVTPVAPPLRPALFIGEFIPHFLDSKGMANVCRCYTEPRHGACGHIGSLIVSNRAVMETRQ
jgi:hypothetical protein